MGRKISKIRIFCKHVVNCPFLKPVFICPTRLGLLQRTFSLPPRYHGPRTHNFTHLSATIIAKKKHTHTTLDASKARLKKTAFVFWFPLNSVATWIQANFAKLSGGRKISWTKNTFSQKWIYCTNWISVFRGFYPKNKVIIIQNVSVATLSPFYFKWYLWWFPWNRREVFSECYIAVLRMQTPQC